MSPIHLRLDACPRRGLRVGRLGPGAGRRTADGAGRLISVGRAGTGRVRACGVRHPLQRHGFGYQRRTDPHLQVGTEAAGSRPQLQPLQPAAGQHRHLAPRRPGRLQPQRPGAECRPSGHRDRDCQRRRVSVRGQLLRNRIRPGQSCTLQRPGLDNIEPDPKIERHAVGVYGDFPMALDHRPGDADRRRLPVEARAGQKEPLPRAGTDAASCRRPPRQQLARRQPPKQPLRQPRKPARTRRRRARRRSRGSRLRRRAATPGWKALSTLASG